MESHTAVVCVRQKSRAASAKPRVFWRKESFLIGEKGAGKIDVTKIMLGLYRDYGGSFLYGGRVKEDFGGSLINGYAYPPQDFPILDLTIRENFQLAAPGKEDRFYEDYLKKANLFEMVMALPAGNGYEGECQNYIDRTAATPGSVRNLMRIRHM